MTEPEYKNECCGNCKYYNKGWCFEPIHMDQEGYSGELKPDHWCSLYEPTTVRKEGEDEKR